MFTQTRSPLNNTHYSMSILLTGNNIKKKLFITNIYVMNAFIIYILLPKLIKHDSLMLLLLLASVLTPLTLVFTLVKYFC